MTTVSSQKTLVSGTKTISLSGGCHSICPLEWLQVTQVTQSELSSLTGSGVWGDVKKFHSDLAYLLVLPKKATEGEKVLRLAVVWVHPYQACVPTLDEAVRKLTLLTASHENWAYAFVRFNEDAQHAPLPKEGHLSAMTEGMPSRSACRCLCQLEVHLLLQLGCWVVYPEGLNGALELVVTSLTESLAHGTNILDESTYLLVDLSKASALHNTSAPTFPTHHTMEHPSRVRGHISMTAEVQELFSQAALDTSSQASGSPSLKRPASIALEDPPPSKAEDSSKPLATSSQASSPAATPEVTKSVNHATSPAKSPGANTGALPEEVTWLQEEMNKTMGCLLMTRMSLDACQQKQVSDFKMALCHNEGKATKAIKEEKAHCGATIREEEACDTTLVREVEAHHATIIREA